MTSIKLAIRSITIILLLSACNIAFCEDTGTISDEEQEFKQDFKLVNAVDDSLSHSDVRDLDAYIKFADGIVQKWRGRNKEYFARLVRLICRPLISGNFNEDRQSVLARNYVLSALVEPDSIPLILGLELTGGLVILFYGDEAPIGDDYAQERAEDTALRIHAWRRLLEAIDPYWDPNDMPYENISPPAEAHFPAGIAPEEIQDTILRAEYAGAIRANAEKARKYSEQYDYSWWLKRIPGFIENPIIAEYSRPPFATKQLKNMLDDHISDLEAKERIIKAVEKNIREWKEEKQ